MSAQNGHWEVVQQVLEAKADKDAATKKKCKTALQLASWHEHLRVVQGPLKAGAEIATQLCTRQGGQGTQKWCES